MRHSCIKTAHQFCQQGNVSGLMGLRVCVDGELQREAFEVLVSTREPDNRVWFARHPCYCVCEAPLVTALPRCISVLIKMHYDGNCEN